MPLAARITDFHVCPKVEPGPVPHVGGPVSAGSPDVNIGYIPAARVDDTAVCVPAVDAISSGSSNVFINDKMAARIGDSTKHGGVVVVGCPTVNIGESAQTLALKNGASSGAPFCEECERLARENKELQPPIPPPDSPVMPSPPAPLEPAAKLAAEPNTGPGDPKAPARRDAREQVAWDALAVEGVPPSAVEAAVRAFDLDQPLAATEEAGAAVLRGTGRDGAPLRLGPLDLGGQSA